MMIPEAWENHESMPDWKRAFYQFHASLMEPWDGPASIAFTDGTVIGAVLDRNGLRPSRYWVTDDGLVVMASEVGVLDIDPAHGRAEGPPPAGPHVPGRHRARAASSATTRSRRRWPPQQPYGEWLHAGLVHLDDLPAARLPHAAARVGGQAPAGVRLHDRGAQDPHRADGPHRRRADRLDGHRHARRRAVRPAAAAVRLLPAAVRPGHQPAARRHPRGAGHVDRQARSAPRATCSTRRRRRAARSCCPSPILTNDELAKLLYINDDGDMPGFKPFAIDGLYPVAEGGEGLRRALERDPGQGVSDAIADGAKLIVLSDRHSSAELAPIPSLLLTSRGAPPPHPREDPHPGRPRRRDAATPARCTTWRCSSATAPRAINPYLAFETIEDLIDQGVAHRHHQAQGRRATTSRRAGKGVLKVMSKMGISTVASYTGAQVFEAIGLGQELVDEYFTGTTSRIGGVGLDVLAEEVAARHRFAYLDRPEEAAHRDLWAGGEYQWRREGEHHLFNPETVFKLQHATRTKRYDVFKEYTTLVDDQAAQLATLRGLFELRDGVRPPVPIDEVEPVSRDRQALLHRGDELRLDLDGGPRDPRHRHEPHRRQVEHRRGRRGPRALRTTHGDRAQRHQAGGVGPLRRHVGVPHQRRRPADQDGPGRQARRGRPAARPQGVPVDRQDPALHARRRPHLARRRTTTSTRSRTSSSSSTT